MTFEEILDQAIIMLQRRGRLTYGTLKRQFQLDDAYLEDLKAELIEGQRLAVDEEGRALVWRGEPVSAPPLTTAPPSTRASEPECVPLASTPAHLAEKILVSRSALEGERKQVTVLFADLKGSMELLADRAPEEARQLLDPVLERMIEAVHRYEGAVNQVMGDGIMALFGAPIAHEDHAVRACYAALRMQETVTHYGDEMQRFQGVPVQIRVGLNAGEVVVRAIDSSLHMDYTAVGPTTHLAARLEQMAKPGSVLTTGETLRLAAGFVQGKALGPVAVKGLVDPVEVFELIVTSHPSSCPTRDRSTRDAEEISTMAKVRLNKVVDLLEHGQTVFSCGTIPNGNYDDILAVSRSAYDMIILETEHVGFDFPTLRHSLQYLLNRKRIVEKGSLQPDIVPLVRVPPYTRERNEWVIKQTLDAGPFGLVLPHFDSVEGARAAVQAARYPQVPGVPDFEPTGERGWSPTLASHYWGLTPQEYCDAADVWPLDPEGELLLMGIVENVRGIANLPDILRQVKGIGAIWAGPGDLSVSMGLRGNSTHPEVEAALLKILAICKECGVPCATGVSPTVDVATRLDQGFRIIMVPPSRSMETLTRGRNAAGRTD